MVASLKATGAIKANEEEAVIAAIIESARVGIDRHW